MQSAVESRGDIIHSNFYTSVIVAEIAKAGTAPGYCKRFWTRGDAAGALVKLAGGRCARL